MSAARIICPTVMEIIPLKLRSLPSQEKSGRGVSWIAPGGVTDSSAACKDRASPHSSAVIAASRAPMVPESCSCSRRM